MFFLALGKHECREKIRPFAWAGVFFLIIKKQIEEKNRLMGRDVCVVNITMRGACTGGTNLANDTRR